MPLRRLFDGFNKVCIQANRLSCEMLQILVDSSFLSQLVSLTKQYAIVFIALGNPQFIKRHETTFSAAFQMLIFVIGVQVSMCQILSTVEYDRLLFIPWLFLVWDLRFEL